MVVEGDTQLAEEKLIKAKMVAIANYEDNYKKHVTEELEWWFDLQEEIQETRLHLLGQDTRKDELEAFRREEEYEKTIKTKYYASGKVYFGQMCPDEEKPHGYGTMYSKVNMFPDDLEECREYEGMWDGGMYHGKGKYFWHNRDSWCGMFWKDRLHGRGVFEKSLYDENGDKKSTEVLAQQRPPSTRFYWNNKPVRKKQPCSLVVAPLNVDLLLCYCSRWLFLTTWRPGQPCSFTLMIAGDNGAL
jgi:hypothetical protein